MAGYVHHGAGTWPAAVPAHRFAAHRPWDPMLIVEIVALIRRWRADVVHTWLPRMDVTGGIAAAIARVPVVVTEPNSHTSYGGELKSRVRVAVARRVAAAVVANSAGGGRYWARGGPEVRGQVVTNSVPVEVLGSAARAARRGR